MIFGNLAIWIALAGTLFSTGAYFLWMMAERKVETGAESNREGPRTLIERYSPLARWGFGLSLAMLVLAIVQLEIAAYRHDFSLSYIARFSNRAEPWDYLFATLWAGQEGTFLLWCAYVTAIGMAVRRWANTYEASVMFFMNLVRLSLLIVLVGKSPFAPTPILLPEAVQAATTFHQTLWAFFHSGGLDLMRIPPDGQGLNPLLMNPWMRIHPPTLFFGFAATTVPFAFAVAALWKKDYRSWVTRALPWTAFSFAVLGAGILLGGYWAYAILGWGGFWGWDPVENSSKVPWLLTVLLLHAMLMQRRKDSWLRATALFGLLPFLAVLYSSFLTRSGILENFSVHSFGKEDDLFPYLIGPLVFFTVGAVGLWLLRWKSFPADRVETEPRSVPAFLYWMATLIGLFAFLVWAGTSSPLLTGIASALRAKLPFLVFLPSAQSNVSQDYYNWIATPVAIVGALLMSAIPFLTWRDTDLKRAARKAGAPVALALVAVLIAVAYGVGRGRPPYELFGFPLGGSEYQVILPAAVPLLAMIFAGSLAVFASLQMIVGAPKKIGRLGGFLSHAGIGFLIVGVVTSELSGASRRVSLVKGEPQQVLGYQVRYDGVYKPNSGGKDALNISFARNGKTFQAPTPVYFSSFNGGYMYEPFIRKYAGHDLYVSPEGPPTNTHDAAKKPVEMVPGQEMELINGLRVRFLDYRMEGRAGTKISVGTELEVKRGGSVERITPRWEAEPESQVRQSVTAKTKDGGVVVEIGELNAEKRSATLVVGGPDMGEPAGPPQEIALISVSTKPMINLVWLATLLMTIGGLLASRAAFGDLRRAEERDRRKDDGDGAAKNDVSSETPRASTPKKEMAGARLARRPAGS